MLVLYFPTSLNSDSVCSTTLKKRGNRLFRFTASGSAEVVAPGLSVSGLLEFTPKRREGVEACKNIDQKRKVMVAREETGAVLDTAQFGRIRGRGGRGRGRGWGNRGHHGRHNRGPHPSDSSATERPPPLTQPSREGDPLGALASCDHDSDKDDPAAESKSGSLIVAPKQMSSALGSLMANYGSQTDSESDAEPETTPILRARDLVQENNVLLNTITPNSDDGAPSRGQETFSQGTENEKVSQSDCANYTPQNRRGRWGRGGRGGSRGRGGHQDTPQMRRASRLLEMLLAPDIRHERNVVLQCVRYVVRNNFFGLESKKRQGEIKDKAAADIPDGEQKRRKQPDVLPYFDWYRD
ncbi:LOW QUALITY PROTEIN: FMR1-interacting protein NUFIP1-like [Tautogolabrus adspersus]